MDVDLDKYMRHIPGFPKEGILFHDIMPLLQQAGIDPLHFGVIFVLNAMIGTITPPVGTIMYVVCALGKISIGQFSREAWPFMIALTICLFIVTYVPILSTWLPDLLMPLR